jgi:hypothetical protein
VSSELEQLRAVLEAPAVDVARHGGILPWTDGAIERQEAKEAALDALWPTFLAVAARTQVVDGEVHFCRLCMVAGPTEAHSLTCEYAALRAATREHFRKEIQAWTDEGHQKP